MIAYTTNFSYSGGFQNGEIVGVTSRENLLAERRGYEPVGEGHRSS